MFIRDGSAIVDITGGAVLARPSEDGQWGLFAISPVGTAILLDIGSAERAEAGLIAVWGAVSRTRKFLDLKSAIGAPTGLEVASVIPRPIIPGEQHA